MSAQGLRPQTKRTLRRASTGRVQRHVRTKQKGDVVFRDIQVAPVDVGDVRQSVQILDLRGVRIVDDLPIFQKRSPRNLLQWFALGVIHDGKIEFFAADKIDLRTLPQR